MNMPVQNKIHSTSGGQPYATESFRTCAEPFSLTNKSVENSSLSFPSTNDCGCAAMNSTRLNVDQAAAEGRRSRPLGALLMGPMIELGEASVTGDVHACEDVVHNRRL